MGVVTMNDLAIKLAAKKINPKSCVKVALCSSFKKVSQ